MSFTYKADIIEGIIEVEVPSSSNPGHRARITVTTREKGSSDRPQYHKPSETVSIHIAQTDLREMIRELERLI